MQCFWRTVIEPVFELVRPEVIVEIGSDQGYNTKCLLDFCEKTGATLHVIDPAPGYDASEWQREHGERLVFHEDLSLNALPQIEGFDAMLIDGDHNWYTVYNELKLIERLWGRDLKISPLCCCTISDGITAGATFTTTPRPSQRSTANPMRRRGCCRGSRASSKKGG